MKEKIRHYSRQTTAIVVMLGVLGGMSVPYSTQASANLVSGGSFERNMYNDWSLWVDAETTRTFRLYRSLSAPFGFGSYSAAIKGTAGTPSERWRANITTQKSFHVEAGAEYYLSFYAKSDTAMNIGAYIQSYPGYERLMPVAGFDVQGEWKKYTAMVTPSQSGQSVFTIVFGAIPAEAELLIDGVNLSRNNLNFLATEVRGNIGERNKALRITGIENFETADVEIELPYYDHMTLKAGTKRFHPESIGLSNAFFHMYEQTFSGIGRVFINGTEIGTFNYTVNPVLHSLEPAMIRANEDITLIGSGFNPLIQYGKMNIIIRTIDTDGKTHEHWLRPHTIDSRLTRVTATAPFGVVSDKVYVQTNYFNNVDLNIINKSNAISYSVKPIIDSVRWEIQGFEQVGDRLLISGRGISYRPTVNFYGADGNRIDSQRGQVVKIYNGELLLVNSTSRLNSYEITVTAGNVESDRESAISYSAKPRVNSVNTKYKRTLYASSENIPATKVGDIITIKGQGFLSANGPTVVEFAGLNTRLPVEAQVDSRGNSLTVEVPAGALNGYLGVTANGEVSNYMPVEIIPTVVSVSPSPAVPGEPIVIRAQGVGANLALAKVFFTLDGNTELDRVPTGITFEGTDALVQVNAPLSMSNNSTRIRLQYDRWLDDGSSVLNVRPHVQSAHINMDNKILSIRGYGFSINPRENAITYRYADENQTIINPKVRMLGVYPTEEGQEIRVQILDNYHYGYVRVQVGEYQSNQVQFGPVYLSQVARRVEFVRSENRVMGVLYINGYNFGSNGAVTVGGQPAHVHYRSNFFIIAVIDQQYLYGNPVVVGREENVPAPASQSEPAPASQPEADTTAPVITLIGGAVVNHPLWMPYDDAGATAHDNVDGNISANIIVGGDEEVDFFSPGTYYITYDVSDSSGNQAQQVVRTVIVN